MDISTAQLIIKNLITEKTGHLEALQTAFSLLEDKFSADFTALETAQSEANTLAVEKNTAIADKNVAVADKEATILNLATETKRADDAELAIDEKDAEIADLTAQLSEKNTPVDVLPVEEPIVGK